MMSFLKAFLASKRTQGALLLLASLALQFFGFEDIGKPLEAIAVGWLSVGVGHAAIKSARG